VAPLITLLRGPTLDFLVERQAWAWLYAVNIYIVATRSWVVFRPTTMHSPQLGLFRDRQSAKADGPVRPAGEFAGPYSPGRHKAATPHNGAEMVKEPESRSGRQRRRAASFIQWRRQA
jgi:hypothetical protein